LISVCFRDLLAFLTNGETGIDIFFYHKSGCTAVSYPRQIPPGGEGKITLKADTTGYGGKKLEKIITVITNDPLNASISLTITGAVEKLVTIRPQRVRLTGPAEEPINASVDIIPEKKYAFQDPAVILYLNWKFVDFRMDCQKKRDYIPIRGSRSCDAKVFNTGIELVMSRVL